MGSEGVKVLDINEVAETYDEQFSADAESSGDGTIPALPDGSDGGADGGADRGADR